MPFNSITSRITSFFRNERNVFLLGLAVAFVATLLEVIRGRASNYYVYSDATRMIWDGLSPYTEQFVSAHGRYFLYLPPFSVIFAPILLLPQWLGPFVWNIGNYCLMFLAIATLPPALRPYRNSIFLFLLPILLQSIFCYQYNVVVCYIFIFAFTLLERGKGLWAVLLIMLSACTKVYGIVELALLFCYPKAWRNFGFAILCGAAMLALPILPALANGAAATAAGGPGEWVISLYSQMVDISNTHHNAVDYVGLLFARGLKPLLLPNYRLVQVCVLAVLAVIFFAMHRRWKDIRFRIQALAALTGYIILFSDCPETHTYIIAMPFWLMAFWLQPRRTWIDWTLFWLVFVNFSILPTDVLCPPKVHDFIHQTFWLDVYSFTLCWLINIYYAVRPR